MCTDSESSEMFNDSDINESYTESDSTWDL